MKELEKIIGYTFRNPKLLSLALTHSSHANERKKGRKSNERLEFLGDSVLSVVVSHHLYENYSHMPEGELTRLRASLVCERSLHKFAQEIRLGDFILLGKGEENTNGRERPSILADAFEALIAAIYLDGGLEAARAHIIQFVPKDTKTQSDAFTDYKTILQEFIQKNPEERIEYLLADESGPDHDKAFTVQVCLNSNIIGNGKGKSKRDAEQMAAKEALELMGYTQT